MNAKEINAKAAAKLSKLTLDQLIRQFELTEHLPMSREAAIVRGWIMDEFERRDADAFAAWIDCDDFNKGPRDFFKAA